MGNPMELGNWVPRYRCGRNNILDRAIYLLQKFRDATGLMANEGFFFCGCVFLGGTDGLHHPLSL